MNRVSPIRDMELVKSISKYLKSNRERDYVMFMCGIYGAMRIGDILRLRVGDVKDKNTINIREQKTGKQRIQKINPELRKIFKEYCEYMDKEEFLIHQVNDSLKPISRVRAYMILRDAAEHFGLENIGTHTMRKTFGYHFYRKSNDAVTLQKILNHSSIFETLVYIGIEQDQVDKAFNSFKLYE